jgi:hypothetical protein
MSGFTEVRESPSNHTENLVVDGGMLAQKPSPLRKAVGWNVGGSLRRNRSSLSCA